jgi:multidrug efflux pump subunit AcrA (membrane-fusion protein)
MRLASLSVAFSLCLLCGGVAWGQTAAATARIDTTSLRLTMPDPYQVIAVLEPIRRVTIVASSDGVLRTVEARLGSPVRESQELAQFDRGEASAKLQVAQAEVKEKQALIKANPGSEVFPAQLEAAQARAALAQIELDRCTIRAPFPGRILNLSVCAGQFVLKGSPILELADTTSLRVVLPVDRRGVSIGSTLTVAVEEQEVPCKVQALLPLPESFTVLRELATPFAAASVVVPNPKGELEPGLRARPSGVPTTAITAVPRRAIRPDEIRGAAGSMVQVIRNEYVTNVPVQVLGSLGNDRIQISGLLRETDALIIGSSVPLMPGTLVRFAETPGVRSVEGTSPDPSRSGLEAGITPPGGRMPAASGRTGAGARRTSPASGPSYPPAQTQSGGGNATPF